MLKRIWRDFPLDFDLWESSIYWEGQIKVANLEEGIINGNKLYNTEYITRKEKKKIMYSYGNNTVD